MKKILLLMAFMPLFAAAQIIVRTDLTTNTKLKDHKVPDDQKPIELGSGDMLKYSVQGMLPISFEQNEAGQPTAWMVGFSASYATLSNKGEAVKLMPSKLFGAGLNVMHLRPISDRCLLMCSLGAGFYSDTQHTTWQQVLGNGGAIFAYQWKPNLLIGAGGGVSNAFGLPMLMPMFYLKYSLEGKYELTTELTNTAKITAARRFGEHFKLELNALEMDGSTAIIKHNDDWKLFGMMEMNHSLSPVYYLSKNASVFGSVGLTSVRSPKTTDRKLSLKNMFGGDNEYRFNAAMHFAIGFRYGM